MSVFNIRLDFQGYYEEEQIEKMPNHLNGIYNVYVGNGSILGFRIVRHIYTGQSTNVKDRILNHGLKKDWENSLKAGERLCYSYCYIGQHRGIAEAAIIHHHKPCFNKEYVNEYPYVSVRMILTGEIEKLDNDFVVNNTTGESI